MNETFDNQYRIGIYVRESRDENGENYETIETQRDLLIDFVARRRIGRVVAVYIDDNASGTGFEREGLLQLQQDCRSGAVDLLLLKDLSRLGRNNAKTLLFLDFLEECGVRVITYDGRYDSCKDNDMVGIETWFNERYAKDISRKIRTNLRFKIQRGEYIGKAPYGYVKSTVCRNTLEICEEEAAVVRSIFAAYLGGEGYGAIARQLNVQEVSPPAGKTSGMGWNAVAIQRILTNRVYIGDTVQGVSEKISFKSKKTRRLPQEDWVVTKGTHAAIIDENTFDKVQQHRAEKSPVRGGHKGELHLFRGIMYCGRCGSLMYARARKSRKLGYICGNYVKEGAAVCSSHFVLEEDVLSALGDKIREVMQNQEVRHGLEQLWKQEVKAGGNELELERLKQQLEARKRQQEVLYLDKLEGKISEELFLRTNTVMEARLRALQLKIKEASSVSEDAGIDGFFLAAMQSLDKEWSREAVQMLVRKIVVYDAGDLMNEGDICSNDMAVVELQVGMNSGESRNSL